MFSETPIPPRLPQFPRFPPRHPTQSPRPTTPPPARRTKPVQPQKQKPTGPIHSRFPFKIGTAVFGTPSYFNVDAAISEFKDFVQANSKLDLNIEVAKHPNLQPSEIHRIPGTGGKSFADPKFLSPETRAKLPLDGAVKIAIYDVQNTTTYWGGATYPPSTTLTVPYIGIPFGGSVRTWGVEPNWRTRTATASVHDISCPQPNLETQNP